MEILQHINSTNLGYYTTTVFLGKNYVWSKILQNIQIEHETGFKIVSDKIYLLPILARINHMNWTGVFFLLIVRNFDI